MFGHGQKTEALTFAILSPFQDLSRFTHFLEDFGQKKDFFGQILFIGQDVPYYMIDIFQNAYSCFLSFVYLYFSKCISFVYLYF